PGPLPGPPRPGAGHGPRRAEQGGAGLLPRRSPGPDRGHLRRGRRPRCGQRMSTALRIAMIGQRGVPATYGGIEHHVEELGARLVERGHEVIVYARPNYLDAPIEEHRGMRVKVLPT